MNTFKLIDTFEIKDRGTVKIVKPLGHFTNKMKKETIGTGVDIDGELFFVKGIEDYAVNWADDAQVDRNIGFLVDS